METPIADAESVLALDIGAIHTRALLFDVVDGQYRFLGASRVESTYGAPFFDISEGIYQALIQLQQTTGHVFLAEGTLILPGRTDGSGIDQLVLTFTAGPGIRVAVLGLLEDVSLESARRLAASTQSILVESIGLNDGRKLDQQIDALIKARPDLVLITGGTDQGATRSLVKMTDLLTIVLELMPQDHLPEIIFAGNQAMQKHITDVLSRHREIQVVSNLRPAIDHENLSPAQDALASAVTRIKSRQLGGLQSYASIASTEPLPTSQALGRLMRFLSHINNPEKTALAVDLGASHTTLAAARQGKLDLSVFAAGMGAGLGSVLRPSFISSLIRWLPMHIADDQVRDILYQKVLFPGSIPATAETLAIETAAARQILQSTLRSHLKRYPDNLTAFEPLIASGATLTELPPGQALYLLLDGLQPTGTSTFVLDPYGLGPALGAIAAVNSILPVQVVESTAFISLGTVISPLSGTRYGTPILRVRYELENHNGDEIEVRQGDLIRLPVPFGQTATVHLDLLRDTKVDRLKKDSRQSFQITGGVCGAVIDARGRPLELPDDAARRRALMKNWAAALEK
jgi:hypothetical protein